MKRILLDLSHILKTTLFAAVKGERAFAVDGERFGHHLDAMEYFAVATRACLRNLSCRPEQIVVVKDGENCKAFRRQFLPDYCKRDPRPKEFYEQYKLLEEKACDFLMSHGAICCSKPGVEADDLIAFLAQKVDCFLWSGDWDLAAIPGVEIYFNGELKKEKFPGVSGVAVTIYKTLVGDSSDKIKGIPGVGEQAFLSMIEKFGIDSCQDLADMFESGDLGTLEQYAAEFKPFQKILDNKELAINTWQCTKHHFPGYDIKWEMRYPTGSEYLPEYNHTQELVTADNFEKAKAELAKDIKEAVVVSLDCETDNPLESKAWCEAARSDSDKEPPVDTIGSYLCGFSLTAGNRTKYFSVKHAETNNISMAQAEQILNMLPTDKPIPIHNTIFELPVFRNHFELKFDRGWLPQNIVDTRILAGMVDENDKVNLKHLTKKWMDYKQTSYSEVLGGKSGMSELTGEEVLLYGCDDTITTAQLFSLFHLICCYEDSYSAYEKVEAGASFLYAESFLNGVKFDMDKLALLHKESQEKYAAIRAKIDEFLINLTWEETEAQPITIEMMRAMREGAEPPPMVVHTKRWPGCEFVPPEKESVAEVKRLYKIWKGSDLQTNSRSVGKVLAEIGMAFHGLVDKARSNFEPEPVFNLRSPKQMGELLYEVLKYPVRLRNKVTDIQRAKGQKQGNPSTNEDALVHGQIHDATPEEKEFLQNIIDAKSCLTEESLFFTNYYKLPHWKDGDVHPSPGQSMTTTGRSAPSRPNLAQMPRGGRIREVIVGGKDYVILSFDLASQELCHAAWHSQDKAMLACYRGSERKDLHSMTGVAIYNLSNDPIDYDEFRRILKDETHPKHSVVKSIRKGPAKVSQFLSLYGGTSDTLALQLRIKPEDAKAIMDAKNAAFPETLAWQERMAEEVVKLGYATEPMGRRRHGNFDGSWKDKHEARSLVNFIIQGGSASQIKLVLSKLWRDKTLDSFKHPCYFYFSVHDSVVFAVHKDDVLDAVKAIHPVMCQRYADFDLDFKSTIDIGPSFGETVEIGEEIEEEKILEVLSAYSRKS